MGKKTECGDHPVVRPRASDQRGSHVLWQAHVCWFSCSGGRRKRSSYEAARGTLTNSIPT